MTNREQNSAFNWVFLNLNVSLGNQISPYASLTLRRILSWMGIYPVVHWPLFLLTQNEITGYLQNPTRFSGLSRLYEATAETRTARLASASGGRFEPAATGG